METPSVLVVDGDKSVQSYLTQFLGGKGYRVDCLDSGAEVLARLISRDRPALLILDLMAPMMGGLEVLSQMERLDYRPPTIVVSAVKQIDMVARAMKLGASEFLEKPFDDEELMAAIVRVLAESTSAGRGKIAQPSECELEAEIVTRNREVLKLKRIALQVAATDVPVLLLGESGVGKEVFARFIHLHSGRGREPFVNVNCAALPPELLESELFGHERGAFTGALREKTGLFEYAANGTILLDEIGEMSAQLQAKLLHVLQDGYYRPLGGVQRKRATARVLASTNRKLEATVAQGAFREDLYFRLNVMRLRIPPLRERPEDIRPLCQYFCDKYRARYGYRPTSLPEELLMYFVNYSWPGNVRQLENAVRRYLVLPDVDLAIAELREWDLERSNALSAGAGLGYPSAYAAGQTSEGNPDGGKQMKLISARAAEQLEREMVLRALEETNWNRKAAARKLNICYRALLNRLHKWNLSGRKQFQESSRGSIQ